MEKGAQAPRDPVPLGYLHGWRTRAKSCNHTRPHHGTAFHTLSSPLQIPRLEGRTGRGIWWRTLQQNAHPRSFPCGRWQPGAEGTAGQETWLTVITHTSTTTGLKNHLRAHRNPLKGSLQPEEDLQGGFGLLLVMISTQLSSLLTKNPWLVPAKHG